MIAGLDKPPAKISRSIEQNATLGSKLYRTMAVPPWAGRQTYRSKGKPRNTVPSDDRMVYPSLPTTLVFKSFDQLAVHSTSSSGSSAPTCSGWHTQDTGERRVVWDCAAPADTSAFVQGFGRISLASATSCRNEMMRRVGSLTRRGRKNHSRSTRLWTCFRQCVPHQFVKASHHQRGAGVESNVTTRFHTQGGKFVW